MDFINQKIGNYRITKEIGVGGMATVYEAVHEVLFTKVAIKIMNPILSVNPDLRRRFEEEPIFMVKLEHESFVKVIDTYYIGGVMAIIMEYLEGEDLESRIKRTGILNINETNNIFLQILDAFEYAHLKGIVHRDIKPSNIFIDKQNKIKVLDFGIAKVFGEGNGMTNTGIQIGTPNFMSPEQVNSDKSIDHRSDIYSLGVLLYYMLTGKKPYISESGSLIAIYNKILVEPFPVYKISGFYNNIIQKAVSKNRNDRYQEIAEFKTALTKENQNVTISAEHKINNLKSTKISFILLMTSIASILIFSIYFFTKENEIINDQNSQNKETINNAKTEKKIIENKIVKKLNTSNITENRNEQKEKNLISTFKTVDMISDNKTKTKYILDEVLQNSAKYKMEDLKKYNSLLEYAYENFAIILPSNQESDEFIYYCNLKNELIHELKKSNLSFDENKLDKYCL